MDWPPLGSAGMKNITRALIRGQSVRGISGGLIARQGSAMSFVTAFRTQRNGSFGEVEYALTRQLMPHVDMALRVQHRIAGLETRLEQASDALDQASHGIIVANSAGMVLF